MDSKVLTTIYAKKVDKVRSCILAKNDLNVFLLANYSNSDVVTPNIEIDGQNLWLLSAYLPHDGETIPHNILEDSLKMAQQKKIGVLL